MEKELKELTVKEALLLLLETDKPIIGYFGENGFRLKNKLCGVANINAKFPFYDGNLWHCTFAIEVEPKYRHMTQQECLDWVCLHSVGYQVKRIDDTKWKYPSCWEFTGWINDYQYRTIQEIDGKIVYGEPQEFKVRVE